MNAIKYLWNHPVLTSSSLLAAGWWSAAAVSQNGMVIGVACLMTVWQVAAMVIDGDEDEE